MKNQLRLGLAILLSTTTLACAGTPAVSADSSAAVAVAAAVADSARPAADTARDADRKPAELVAFAGIKPGDQVADLMPGGGYFTRIFSKLVGPQGHVYAVVPASIAAAKPAALDGIKALAADPAYRNTSLEVQPYERIAADNSLDVAWTSQNYHDVYGAVSIFRVSGKSGAEEAAALDAAVFKALKPGGIYIVVDHAAKAGAGGSVSNTLHRIEPATVIEQVKAAGFVLEARSELLANPQDDHEQAVFATEIKGRTDKFVLKFRKPRS